MILDILRLEIVSNIDNSLIILRNNYLTVLSVWPTLDDSTQKREVSK